MPYQYKRIKSKERKEKLTLHKKRKYTVIPAPTISGGSFSVVLSAQNASELVNTMNLSELLEASKIVDMRAKGEVVSNVASPKAEAYAGEVLKLNKQIATKPMAENLINILTGKILETNKKTTNYAKSKKLYRKLMAEE